MHTNKARLILIYITAPTKSEAKRLLKMLIEKRIVACGNISKIESIYRWKGKITEAGEWTVIAKTLEANFEKAKREIEKVHPYEIPCIIKIPSTSNEKFFSWLRGELKHW